MTEDLDEKVKLSLHMVHLNEDEIRLIFNALLDVTDLGLGFYTPLEKKIAENLKTFFLEMLND